MRQSSEGKAEPLRETACTGIGQEQRGEWDPGVSEQSEYSQTPRTLPLTLLLCHSVWDYLNFQTKDWWDWRAKKLYPDSGNYKTKLISIMTQKWMGIMLPLSFTNSAADPVVCLPNIHPPLPFLFQIVLWFYSCSHSPPSSHKLLVRSVPSPTTKEILNGPCLWFAQAWSCITMLASEL